MNANETFDKAYAATGSAVLAQLKRIRELVTDYPADSSTGADWTDLGDLSRIASDLNDILKFMGDDA